MWGRVIEIMTGVWLAMSPFIFRVADDRIILWGDLGVALLIWLLAGLSYWPPTRHAHVAILLVAIGLITWGRLAAGTEAPPPAHQNHIAVGIFLLMIAIVPNYASHPPRGWRASPEPTGLFG